MYDIATTGKWRLGALLIAGVLAATACGAPETSGDDGSSSAAAEPTVAPGDRFVVEPVEYPVTVTDGGGQEVTFEEPVSQIGCLSGVCDSTLAADLGVTPVALCGFTPGVLEQQPVFLFPDGTAPIENLNVCDDPEVWARTGAELLIDWIVTPDELSSLEQAAPVIQTFDPTAPKGVNGIDAYFMNLEMFGQVTGRTDEAQAAVDRYYRLVDALKERAPADAADTEVALVLYSNDGTYLLPGPQAPFCQALEDNELGHCLVPDGWNADTWEINAEALLAADPDWIAYMIEPLYSAPKNYEEDYGTIWQERDDPVWGELSAVKNGQVYDSGGMQHCCSLRGIEHALQEYAYHVWGEEGGVPDPGMILDFVPGANFPPAG
jgi:ABC-type Fe3+-hydroxamate transport system substrate-binding protein